MTMMKSCMTGFSNLTNKSNVSKYIKNPLPLRFGEIIRTSDSAGSRYPVEAYFVCWSPGCQRRLLYARHHCLYHPVNHKGPDDPPSRSATNRPSGLILLYICLCVALYFTIFTFCHFARSFTNGLQYITLLDLVFSKSFYPKVYLRDLLCIWFFCCVVFLSITWVS